MNSTEAADPMPTSIRPMAATPSALPAQESGWGFEIKWDGVRVVTHATPGRLRLFGRDGQEFTGRYPELDALGEQIGTRRVILDGEIVAFDDEGQPSFQRLQPRIHAASEADARHGSRTAPVIYVIFDVLYAGGRSLLRHRYEDRRHQLTDLGLAGPHWQVPTVDIGEGSPLLEATRAQGLEGVIAKRLDSPYRPGRRSRDWLKIKNVHRQEVVIGGWTPGQGSRADDFGALLVGYRDSGGLRYAGKVGTGFDLATRRMLRSELDALHTRDSPFTGRQPQRDAVFAEPRLVCEVEFAQWTSDGTLRHPTYQGLRRDKDPQEVVREEPLPPPDA
ncbi:bifunctional non-homologous end joining protein LigD [Haloactinopolyspora alba]|uniref:DNA ligase (ATP) n=1 Tax=Haloactinopolyspora alba TaxID=648780 RepID=A0A2P8DWE1_9ACTN|nr:non-homologous end-joining DNA ligase [Haloactinopolyspora alba]PSL01536.1 bifunctional non-homologous end joining protein LigD [Haloactinopolyspora alba]